MRLKKIIVQNFKELDKMPLNEYLLYLKWVEVNNLKLEPFNFALIDKVKNNMWLPEKEDDYKKLKPVITYVNTQSNLNIWNTIKTFTSLKQWKKDVGRNMKYILHDDVTKKYLGISMLSTDSISLKARDNYIGWNYEQRTFNHSLSNIALCTTECVEPILATLMMCDREVLHTWMDKYNDPLFGLTTLLPFDEIDNWHNCGEHKKYIQLISSKIVLDEMKKWKAKMYPKVDTKNDRSLFLFVCNKLGLGRIPVKVYKQNVYFCEIYKKSKDALSFKSVEADFIGMPNTFNKNVDSLIELWRTKYIKKVDVKFYDDLIGKSWKDVRSIYKESV